MSMPTRYFLLVYPRPHGPVSVTEFAEVGDALRALNQREAEKSPQEEVVLLGGDSLETLKVTHSRYFLTPAEIGDGLGALGDPQVTAAR